MNWASRQLALKLECSMLGATAVARRVLPLQWVSSLRTWCRCPGCDRVAGGTSRQRSCAAVRVATELPEGRAAQGAVPPSGLRPSCRRDEPPEELCCWSASSTSPLWSSRRWGAATNSYPLLTLADRLAWRRGNRQRSKPICAAAI
jgi:hypothetical protein